MSKLFQTNKNSEEENKMSKDLVFIQNDQVLTDSRVVAEYFDKRHDHVLRDIERCKGDLPKNGGVENALIKSSYTDAKGEQRPMYLMNRDGFMFVVMGFTGEKAAQLKWNYIQAFNAMESELKKQHEQASRQVKVEKSYPVENMLRDVKNTKSVMIELGVSEGIAMAKAISLVEKYNQFDLSEIKSLAPSTTDETGCLNPTQIGEKVGISNRRVNKLLRDLGYQYKENDEWFLTELGKKYGEKFPYENNGHSGYQIRWNEEVVDKIKECL